MARRGWALAVMLLSLLLLRQFSASAGMIRAEECLVWIDLEKMSLTVYQNGREMGRWPVACGRGETPTPVGIFRINRRFTTEGTGFGTRFLGLNVPWGQFGIHGTNEPHSIGARVSHGCIRMYNRDVEQVYRMVPNGARVVIEDGPYGEISGGLKELTMGERGALVRAAQRKLKALGFYWGALDGVYGEGMEKALQNFCREKQIDFSGKINSRIWSALGVMRFE